MTTDLKGGASSLYIMGKKEFLDIKINKGQTEAKCRKKKKEIKNGAISAGEKQSQIYTGFCLQGVIPTSPRLPNPPIDPYINITKKNAITESLLLLFLFQLLDTNEGQDMSYSCYFYNN
ncbi:hypothetical protein PPERSA_08089 [Pseudocohnilembus persalinus]|uniref:Uncharacterized protein n=1 Tax=Pseudocohnilembus persalinus TaxID=266149 RepID=A0A0V0R370_PSEPJ|nr:hypothetical protein PPERSA_08089 [Pseudocohnilembus persalinus]|eukprot:KRX08778.1 hypothetical protein PPERSA_08089 [Pseudocohnilembus persalinus]